MARIDLPCLTLMFTVLIINCIMEGTSSPIPSQSDIEASKPTGEILGDAFYALELVLKNIVGSKLEGEKTAGYKVLLSIKELMDLKSTLDKISSLQELEGSGETTVEFEATMSLIEVVIKDSCEWMKSTLKLDESLDCSNETEAYAITTLATLQAAVAKAGSNLAAVNQEYGGNAIGYCNWVHCNFNPVCKSTASQDVYNALTAPPTWQFFCSAGFMEKQECNTCSDFNN